MADSDSDSSGWSDIIRDWTMVNRFGEVESDDLASERHEADDHSLPRSASSHAGQQECEEFHQETVSDGDAASVTTAEATVGSELPFDQGSAAGEDNYISSEVAEQCETGQAGDERVEGDVDKAEEPHHVVHDAESCSSGSSIELLDISDEGHDHAAAESASEEKDSNDENVVEVQCDADEVGQSEVMDVVQEFADASQSVMSSSTDDSGSVTGSESLTSEDGEVGQVSAGIQLEGDAVDIIASKVTDDDDDEMEMERSRESEQLQQNEELAQSAVMTSSPVDGSTAASHHGSIVSDVASETELLSQTESVSDAHHDDKAAHVDELEKADGDESIATDADMSLVSSVSSSVDIDMLPDAHLADGIADEVEAEAVNVDDRCESDISGVATDDTDLSSMSFGADIAMEMGSMVYRHQPNPVFNTLLTCCTVLMLCFAVGIGVGHYFGSSTMPVLCEQQLYRLKSLQDEQYLCLSRLQQFEYKLQTMTDAEHTLTAVKSVWVRKYEELVKERAHLEHSLNISKQMTEKTMDLADDYHRKLNDSQAAVQFLAREVDRLSTEMNAANDSRQSAELVVVEWKNRFDAAQVEMKELEQELLSTRAEADEAEQSLDVMRRDVSRLSQEKASSHVVAEGLRDEIAALKNVVNQQKLEKAELEAIILSQRYSEHPGNVATPSEPVTDRYTAETDAYHHDDDTASTSQAAPNSSLDAGYELSMEFVRLRKFIGRVSVELHGKDESSGGGLVAEDGIFNIPTDAVLVTMLKYLMTSGKQSANLDLPSQMTSYSRALRQVTDCIEVLDNLTLSQQVVKTLMSPWHEIPSHLVLANGNYTSRVMETLDLCRQQFASSSNSKGDTGADPVSVVDNMIRQYMNRTLETVSQLSHTVQTTLDRMKTLPEELFAENKTAKKIGRRLTDAVNKLNTKVQSGWKHVASKFEDVRKRWFGYSESKTCRHKKREEHKKHSKKKKVPTATLR